MPPMFMPSKIRLALLGCLTTAACSAPRPDTPIDAYLAFTRAAEAGDARTAFAALTEESRKALEARAAAAKPLKAEAADFFLARAERPQPPKEVTVVEETGDRAAVRVTPAQGTPQTVRLRKEGAAWRVDAMPFLSKSEARTPTPG